MRKTSFLGLESIDFQSQSLFVELTAAYEDMRKLSADKLVTGNNVDASAPDQILTAIIRNSTKINSLTVYINDLPPCVRVPLVDRNNPLINDIDKNWLDNRDGLKIIRESKGFSRGGVNLAKSTVSGVFQEVPCEVYIPHWLITNRNFTAEELAGITLHEIGHVFTYLECLTRMVRTSQILAGVSRAMDGTNTQKERETILLSVKEAMKLKDMDPTELAKFSDKSVVQAIVISNVIKQTRSELGTNIYDSNNFEMLADQFAVRHGAGRALVTGMEKFYRLSNNMATRSQSEYIYVEVMKFVMLAFAGAMTVATLTMTPAALFALNAALWGLAFFGMVYVDSAVGVDYDRPLTRLKRMRNDLVEAIKTKGLPESMISAYRQDIVVIDKTMEGVKDRTQWLGLIALHVFGMGKKRFEAETLQQELESLVANNLFLSAHDIKALA